MTHTLSSQKGYVPKTPFDLGDLVWSLVLDELIIVDLYHLCLTGNEYFKYKYKALWTQDA